MSKIDLEAEDWSLLEMARMHHLMRNVAAIVYNSEKCPNSGYSEHLAFDMIRNIVKSYIKVPDNLVKVTEVK